MLKHADASHYPDIFFVNKNHNHCNQWRFIFEQMILMNQLFLANQTKQSSPLWFTSRTNYSFEPIDFID